MLRDWRWTTLNAKVIEFSVNSKLTNTLDARGYFSRLKEGNYTAKPLQQGAKHRERKKITSGRTNTESHFRAVSCIRYPTKPVFDGRGDMPASHLLFWFFRDNLFFINGPLIAPSSSSSTSTEASYFHFVCASGTLKFNNKRPCFLYGIN